VNTENAKAGRRWRPNLFDLVIVLLIAAVGAVLYMMVRPTAAAVVQTTPMRYTVEMLNLPEGTHELMQVGDEVIDSSKNYPMGTVVGVEVTPYTIEADDQENGVVRQAPVAGYETVLLTLEADMVVTDSSITTEGGYLVRVGLATKTKGDNFAATGYIVAIER